MKRLPTLVTVLTVVAVLTSPTAAVAIAWAMRANQSPIRMGPGMMAGGSTSAPGWWDDSWGSSMRGRMGWSGVASEPEYLAEMIAHHQEAVAAARELDRSDRAEMHAFGESIVKTQTAQLRQMRRWLKEWHPDQPTTVDYRPMMRDLSELSGDKLDQAFLKDMIGHHMAAVMMSQQLLWLGPDHEQVADLARVIRDDQHREIIQMERWLARWFEVNWRRGGVCGSSTGQGSGWDVGPGMMGAYGR